MQPCIFCQIISKKIPAKIVYEDDNSIAFLDINPLKAGHTLVVPKKETDYIYDLDDVQLAGLFLFSKKVAAAIKSVIPCNRIGVAILGLEVPHAHVHLVPMDTMEDVNFKNTKLKFSSEEFNEIATKISRKVIL